MSDPVFSSSWYRVAGLHPRLRSHARIHRHVYRGRPWYVLQDLTNQKFHRFTPAAHTVLGLMDGERTVHAIWMLATEALGDDAPTQDDMIRLLAQLHAADVLQCDVPPDTLELLERFEKKERRELWGRFLNPFAVRIPLLDPERFLARTLPAVRPLVGWGGLALWLAVVLPALFLAGLHWSELTGGFLDRVLTPQNLLLIWLLFPVIKALHELGHGFVAKAFGCEVHDMGIMFLVFTPIPYVDASAASALAEARRRALVGAGGMVVEVFIAALAFYIWLGAEPGVIRTLAFNTMLIGGVTTVGFNGNPLLRFDGYYILADLIGIPNLRARANSWLGYLLERYAFGRRKAERPETTPGEPTWLVSYAVASFVYRVMIVVAIFLFVLEKSMALGLLLIALSSIGWFIVPAARMGRMLFGGAKGDEGRARPIAVLAGAVAALVLGLGVLPFPYRTQTEGVVWIPEESLVRTRTDGYVERLVATPGAWTRAGDVLIECRDPDLEAEAKVLAARLRVLNARYHQERVQDQVRAQMVDEERDHVRKRLEDARRRLRDLVIRSAVDGRFVPAQPEDLPGRYVLKGQALAHIVTPDGATVRAVVHQDDIDLVLKRATTARIRLAERLGEVVEAPILRVVPAASDQLPSTALGSAGGGRVPIDPRDERGMSALEKLFVVELGLPGELRTAGLGGRVHVRFDHGSAPLAEQWFRELRQLFLSRLDV